MSEATSKQAVVTEYSRGTACYRAPELLRGVRGAVFTNKVDIWSLGCVLGEVFSGKKVFDSDWAVHQYDEATTEIEVELSSWIPSSLQAHIHQMLQELLHRDYTGRPRGPELRRLLASYRFISSDYFSSILNVTVGFPKYSKWKRLVAKHRTDPALIEELINDFSTAGNIQPAIMFATERIHREPENLDHWVHLERIYRESGKKDSAIDGWASLVRAFPRIRTGHFLLTVSCLRWGGHKLACTRWSKLIELYPETKIFIQCYDEVQGRHLNIRDWPTPDAILKELVEEHPQEYWYQDELDRALDASEGANAVEVWRDIIRSKPSDSNFQDRLWGACGRVKLDNSAKVEIWKELVMSNPDCDGLGMRLNLALAESAENPQAAIAIWRQILKSAKQPSRLHALHKIMEPLGHENRVAVWESVVSEYLLLRRDHEQRKMQDWEDETISKVMLVTLDARRAGGEYIFLPSILEDLTDQGQGTLSPHPRTIHFLSFCVL
jgi:tetratricopeptide (TPR) repeat protein